MSPAWSILLDWVMVSGLAGFILMGLDKARAIDKSWRIPEITFFTLAFLGGTFGVLLGSGIFHHKTLKASFMGVIILSAVMWLAILFAFERLAGLPFG